MTAGETSRTLFEVHSLFDLVRHPSVRLLANQRFEETVRDVTEEAAHTHGDSFEHRRSENGSIGWRRNQAGKGTTWATPDDAALADWAHVSNNTFRVESSGESRNRTEHLGFESVAEQLRDGVLSIGRVIIGQDWTMPDAVEDFFETNTSDSALLQDWDDLWECLLTENETLTDLLRVDGLRNFSVPPFAFPEEFLELIGDLLRGPFDMSPDDQAALLTSNPIIGPMLAIQGMSFGANLGMSQNVGSGVALGPVSFNSGGGLSSGMSISASPQLPSMVRTSSTGTTGAVSRVANKQCLTYAQHLNKGYDDSETYVRYLANEDDIAGTMHRTVTRDLLKQGSIRKRRPGVNIHWQGRTRDIVTGSIPLNVVLPATADKIYRTSDEMIRVRFPNGIADLHVDIWFDLTTEVLKDDY